MLVKGNSVHKANTVLSNSLWGHIIASENLSYGVTVFDICFSL
jgi:hypothetical protein